MQSDKFKKNVEKFESLIITSFVIDICKASSKLGLFCYRGLITRKSFDRLYEPRHEKTGFLPMQKQRRISAVQ